MSTTTVKPAQMPSSLPQVVKLFLKPCFGITVKSTGLEVAVSAGPDISKTGTVSHG